MARPRKQLDETEIQRRLAAGDSVRKIARALGVANHTIALRLVPPAPEPGSVPIIVPEPWGLAEVPVRTKQIFVVRGSLNWQYCGGYRPNVIAVGIDEWDESYASLPAIRNAEKVWVVVTQDEENPPEANARFLMSLVTSSIREWCWVSHDGVREVAKARYWQIQRTYPTWGRDESFVTLCHFQPLPEPGAESSAG